MVHDRSPALPVAVAAGIAAVLGGAYLLLRETIAEPAEQPPPPAAQPEKTPVSPPVAPATELPAKEKPAGDVRPIVYPDGSMQAPLNGVNVPAPLHWPPQIPFSKVVGKFTHVDGLEWYLHEDGSQSTTQMVWRSDLGRMDAVTRVSNPTVSAPIPEDERNAALQEAQRQQQQQSGRK